MITDRVARLTAVTVALGALIFTASAVLAPPRDPAPPAAAAQAPAPGSVEAIQIRLDDVPGDWTAWAALGDAHVRAAISNADPSKYVLAEEAYNKSLELEPENTLALTGQASLAASRHDFSTALELARRSQVLNPYSASNQGILVDALIELGRYEEAEVELQRMLDLQPSTASLARASYFRELHGDISGARLALEDAERFAAALTDQLYAIQYLGELAWAHGDPETALFHYNRGLEIRPGDPGLLAARAEVLAAQGDLEGSIEDYRNSVEQLPEAAHLAEYAAVLEVAGRTEEAEGVHEEIRARFADLEAAGSNIDLELAYYEAAVGRTEEALAAAEREYALRRSVQTEDALAFTLHLAGRNAEALPHAVAAEALSDQDGVVAYHRGLIELALGMPEAADTLARAVELNPYSTEGRAAAELLNR